MKGRGLLVIGGVMVFLTSCGIFPREEELQRTPIIQAYQQEEFRMAKVKRGDLKLYERLDAVCMGIGETSYSFVVNDLSYKGIYVMKGDMVEIGTILAELEDSYTNNQVANRSQLKLTAKESGRVTYVMENEEGGKCISGQLVVVTNSRDSYYFNAYTKYWNKFENGMQITIRIRGEDYTATIVEAQELGLEASKRPEDPEELSEVYFKVKVDNLYLQSTEVGTVKVLIEQRNDVLYVPESAVTMVNDKEIVYVEDQNGIRSVKYIETGLHADSKVEIVSGLSEDDSVILE